MHKEIYATLQVCYNEVLLLVCQIRNGRTYVLNTQKIYHNAIKDNVIIKPDAIVSAIKEAVSNARKELDYVIDKIILVVNSIDLNLVTKKFHSDVNDPLGRILKDNIQNLYYQASLENNLNGLQLTNIQVYQYKVNSNTMLKVPINEKALRVYADMDLYYINREYLYQMAMLVEGSGLEIQYVVIDQIAFGQEASLVDHDSNKYYITLLCNSDNCSLGLYYKGKLVHSHLLDVSFNKWIEKLSSRFNIPYEMAEKLIMNNFNPLENNPDKRPVSVWRNGEHTYSASQLDIYKVVEPLFSNGIKQLKDTCQEILNHGDVEILLGGSWANLKNLAIYLEKNLNVKCNLYVPQTIGARNSIYTCLLGACYNYHDQKQWLVRDDNGGNV